MNNVRYHILGRSKKSIKKHYGIIQRYGDKGLDVKLSLIAKSKKISKNNIELFNRVLEVILDYYDLEDCNKASVRGRISRRKNVRIKDVNDLYQRIEKIK